MYVYAVINSAYTLPIRHCIRCNNINVYVVAEDVTQMEPRAILRGGTMLIYQFVEYYEDNLPDISEKPDIPPSKVQYWMMDDKGFINPKKR